MKRLIDRAFMTLVFVIVAYFIVEGIVIPAWQGLMKLLAPVLGS